jgi:hypothetical protein
VIVIVMFTLISVTYCVLQYCTASDCNMNPYSRAMSTQHTHTLTHLSHVRTYTQLAETLLTVPGLVDASTGRMRGRLIPSQFESRKASELKTDEYNLGEHTTFLTEI